MQSLGWVTVCDGDHADVLFDEELLAVVTVRVLSVCSDEDGSYEAHHVQENKDYMIELTWH